jgi:hypothetical protein
MGAAGIASFCGRRDDDDGAAPEEVQARQQAGALGQILCAAIEPMRTTPRVKAAGRRQQQASPADGLLCGGGIIDVEIDQAAGRTKDDRRIRSRMTPQQIAQLGLGLALSLQVLPGHDRALALDRHHVQAETV